MWCGLAGDHQVVTFGLSDAAQVRASAIVRDAEGVRFTLHTPSGDAPIELHLLGLHNARNALGAAAAAIVAGATLESIRAGLAQVRAVPGRLHACAGLRGEIVIDDSYNANPGAVKAAIDVLAEYAGVRQLILGNMAELGADAEQLHREVARYAAERGIEILWCVGPHALAQVDAFWRQSLNVRAKAFANNDVLIAELTSVAPATVLVKGSRSAGTETIVAALCGASAQGAH